VEHRPVVVQSARVSTSGSPDWNTTDGMRDQAHCWVLRERARAFLSLAARPARRTVSTGGTASFVEVGTGELTGPPVA